MPGLLRRMSNWKQQLLSMDIAGPKLLHVFLLEPIINVGGDGKCCFLKKFLYFKRLEKCKKAAIVSNFVDREAERPALGPNDFLPLPMITFFSESEQQAFKTNKNKIRTKTSVPKKVLDTRTNDGRCNSSLITHGHVSQVETLAEIRSKNKRNSGARSRKKSRDERQSSSLPVSVGLEECSVPSSLGSCTDDEIPIALLKTRCRVTACSQKARKRLRAYEDQSFAMNSQKRVVEEIPGDRKSPERLCTDSSVVRNESGGSPELEECLLRKPPLVYTRKSKGLGSVKEKVLKSEGYDVPLSVIFGKRPRKMVGDRDSLDKLSNHIDETIRDSLVQNDV